MLVKDVIQTQAQMGKYISLRWLRHQQDDNIIAVERVTRFDQSESVISTVVDFLREAERLVHPAITYEIALELSEPERQAQ